MVSYPTDPPLATAATPRPQHRSATSHSHRSSSHQRARSSSRHPSSSSNIPPERAPSVAPTSRTPAIGSPTTPFSPIELPGDSVVHLAPAERSESRTRRSASTAPPPPRRLVHHSRAARSVYSNSNHAPTNEFPCFTHTGDVEILVAADPNGPARGQERRYLLHRLILSQCSGFFEAGMREEWGRGGPPEASTISAVNGDMGETMPGGFPGAQGRSGPGKTRWRYELDWEDVDDDEMPMLVQKDPTTSPSLFGPDDHTTTHPSPPCPPPVRPKPQPPHQGFFRSLAGNFSTSSVHQHRPTHDQPQQHHHHHHHHQKPPQYPYPTAYDPDLPHNHDDTLRDHDNLLRCFYNFPPLLHPTNIAIAYVEAKSLLHLASAYQALSVVAPRVDHHLLSFRGKLHKQIAKYPPSYLKLGWLCRSKAIFSEALVHVVGTWPAGASQLRGGGPGPAPLAPVILELVLDKVDERQELRARVEGKLWRLSLTTSRGERVSPFTAPPLDWLAVSLFRHWLAEALTPPPAPILKGGGGKGGAGATTAAASAPPPRPPDPLLTLLRPSAYLPRDDLRRFLKLHPHLYTKEGLRRFERKVEEIKRLAAGVVESSGVGRCLLEGAGGGGLGGDGGASAAAAAGSVAASLGYLTCVGLGRGEWEGLCAEVGGF